MSAEKVQELPTKTINREELEKDRRFHRLVAALGVLGGLAASVITGVFVAGQLTGGLQTDVKNLRTSVDDLSSQSKQLQGSVSHLDAAATGLQVEVTNLKTDLERERQDRINSENRELERRWAPTRN